jgi:hypothetical protein
MGKWNHLEPSLQGPSLPEALAVVMLFSVLMFIVVCCAFGELVVRIGEILGIIQLKEPPRRPADGT